MSPDDRKILSVLVNHTHSMHFMPYSIYTERMNTLIAWIEQYAARQSEKREARDA